MRELLLFLYFFTFSWTSAFSLTWAVSFPVIFSCLFGVSVLTNIIRKYIVFNLFKAEIFLLAFLILVWISYILNYLNFISSKPTNHLIAYSFTCIVLYFSIRLYFTYLNSFIKNLLGQILKWLSFGVFISAIFGLIEFFGKNIFNIPIDEFIPRSFVEEYAPTFLGKFIRLRSFVEESGHYALFIEICLPLMIYYFFYHPIGKRVKKIIAYIYISTTIIAFILTFSSAGITIAGIMLISLAITISIKKVSLNFFLTLGVIIILLTSVVMWVNSYLIQELDINLTEAMNILTIEKATDSGSQMDRSERIDTAFKEIQKFNLLHILFGYGPAAYDTLQIEIVIGLYVVVLLETGFIGLFFFIVFFIFTFLRIFSLADRPFRIALTISISSALIHYLFIGNYFYPWLWFACAIVYIHPSNYEKKN